MKSRIFQLLISLGILMLWLPVLSQPLTQTVKGTVIDRETQMTLPGASVVIQGTQPLLGDAANIDGNFRITGVPLGRYHVKASFMGYEDCYLYEVVVASGKEVVLRFEMKPLVIRMAEVKVKAHADKTQTVNVMASISSRKVNMEEANRFAGGFDDPARLATAFSGVAGSMSNNAVIIRGNSAKGLLWQMEGVEIATPSHFANVTTFGGGGITALSSQMLTSSDFCTGAFPAEYGNALSGVFDLKLRTGNADKSEYTVKLGTIGLDVAAEGPFRKGSRATWLFNYRYSSFALIAPFLPDNAGNVGYQDFCFKLNFPILKSGTLAFWGILSSDVSGQKANKDSTEWKYESDLEKQDSRQYMGALGLNYRRVLNASSYLNASLATSGSGIHWTSDKMNSLYTLFPSQYIKDNQMDVIGSAYVNYRLRPGHVNRTGFVVKQMNYEVVIRQSDSLSLPLKTITDGTGKSLLLQAYSQSKLTLSAHFNLNIGIHVQYFGLNGNTSAEPRAGMKWDFAPGQALSLGYGLHSQTEMLQFYLLRQTTPSGSIQPNKDLPFTKAHHLVLGYDLILNEFTHMKAELYYQYLFDVPVVDHTSFSMLNIDNDWYFNEKLTGKGTGKNYGLDLTLEQYMNHGFYYLATASMFESRYKGGDGVERDTRYNKHFVINFLAGKEWKVGKEKNHVLSVNGRLNYMGGDRISPVDVALSQQTRDIVYDETRAFSRHKPDVLYADLTINYKKNKKKYAGTWSIQLINLLGTKEFNGYRYNTVTGRVETFEEVTMVPNISYKVDF